MKNPDSYQEELDELIVHTALDILLERALAGDEQAEQDLFQLSEDAKRAVEELALRRDKQEGSN